MPIPLQDNGQKKLRSVYTTDRAWNGLKQTASQSGLSLSELIERIGRNSSSLETPFHTRLKAFIEAPISVWWSLSEAVRRYHLQLGLAENHREVTKPYLIEERLQDQQEKIRDCLWRAMVILSIINYGIPDFTVNSLNPLLRWISFKMLYHKAEHAEPSSLPKAPSLLISESVMDSDLQKIDQALILLQCYSSSYYELLDIVMLNGGMTYIQAARYKRLNTNQNVTELEIRHEVRQAIYQLRSYFHGDVKGHSEKLEIKKDSYHNLKKQYYKLCATPYLSAKDRKVLEAEFLLKAINNPTLKFWIQEIDHMAGHHLLGHSDSAHINSSYQDIHYVVRSDLALNLKDESRYGDTLRSKLVEIDKKLMFCKSITEICRVVDEVVQEISEGSLSLSTILHLPKEQFSN